MKKSVFFVTVLFLVSCFQEKNNCIDGDCVNGSGLFTFNSGASYDGEWKDGVMNGVGKYTLEFKDEEYYPNEYIGEFVNGKRNGIGVIISYDPYSVDKEIRSILVGVFADDTLKEDITKKRASCLSGDCEDGIGKKISILGDISNLSRLRNGASYKFGSYITTYEGGFKSGVRHGNGNLTSGVSWEETNYIGEFKNGVRDGSGVYKSNKMQFDGIWRDDKPIKGVRINSNGDKYEGEWNHNSFKGKVTYAETMRKTQLTDGRPAKYKGPKTEEGTFIKGELNGYGVRSWSLDFGNNDSLIDQRYEGYFVNGEKHGQGTYYHYSKVKIPNLEWSKKFVGEFDCCSYEKPRRTGIYYYSDGTQESGVWEED